MNTSNLLKNKHLSYEDRKQIEKSLNNGLNFSKIGLLINKPYKTISNEIKRNRIFEASTAFSLYGSKLCDKLNKPPYVCNGCPSRNGCKRKKYYYYANDAQVSYNDRSNQPPVELVVFLSRL